MRFAWGINDCVLFAAAAVEAVTGKDLSEPYRNYESRAGAKYFLRRIVKEKSYYDCMRLLPTHFGFKRIDPKQAQRGDLVLLTRSRVDPVVAKVGVNHASQPNPWPSAPALGVVSLDGRYAVVPGPEGLVRTPMDRAFIAWRV